VDNTGSDIEWISGCCDERFHGLFSLCQCECWCSTSK